MYTSHAEYKLAKVNHTIAPLPDRSGPPDPTYHTDKHVTISSPRGLPTAFYPPHHPPYSPRPHKRTSCQPQLNTAERVGLVGYPDPANTSSRRGRSRSPAAPVQPKEKDYPSQEALEHQKRVHALDMRNPFHPREGHWNTGKTRGNVPVPPHKYVPPPSGGPKRFNGQRDSSVSDELGHMSSVMAKPQAELKNMLKGVRTSQRAFEWAKNYHAVPMLHETVSDKDRIYGTTPVDSFHSTNSAAKVIPPYGAGTHNEGWSVPWDDGGKCKVVDQTFDPPENLPPSMLRKKQKQKKVENRHKHDKYNRNNRRANSQPQSRRNSLQPSTAHNRKRRNSTSKIVKQIHKPIKQTPCAPDSIRAYADDDPSQPQYRPTQQHHAMSDFDDITAFLPSDDHSTPTTRPPINPQLYKPYEPTTTAAAVHTVASAVPTIHQPTGDSDIPIGGLPNPTSTMDGSGLSGGSGLLLQGQYTNNHNSIMYPTTTITEEPTTQQQRQRQDISQTYTNFAGAPPAATNSPMDHRMEWGVAQLPQPVGMYTPTSIASGITPNSLHVARSQTPAAHSTSTTHTVHTIKRSSSPASTFPSSNTPGGSLPISRTPSPTSRNTPMSSSWRSPATVAAGGGGGGPLGSNPIYQQLVDNSIKRHSNSNSTTPIPTPSVGSRRQPSPAWGSDFPLSHAKSPPRWKPTRHVLDDNSVSDADEQIIIVDDFGSNSGGWLGTASNNNSPKHPTTKVMHHGHSGIGGTSGAQNIIPVYSVNNNSDRKSALLLERGDLGGTTYQAQGTQPGIPPLLQTPTGGPYGAPGTANSRNMQTTRATQIYPSSLPPSPGAATTHPMPATPPPATARMLHPSGAYTLDTPPPISGGWQRHTTPTNPSMVDELDHYLTMSRRLHHVPTPGTATSPASWSASPTHTTSQPWTHTGTTSTPTMQHSPGTTSATTGVTPPPHVTHLSNLINDVLAEVEESVAPALQTRLEKLAQQQSELTTLVKQ